MHETLRVNIAPFRLHCIDAESVVDLITLALLTRAAEEAKKNMTQHFL